jgi:hypothetical protein
MDDVAFFVDHDLGFNRMGFLLSRVAAALLSPFGALFGGVDDKLQDFFFRKIGFPDGQSKDRFDRRPQSGKMAANGAVMDIKQRGKKCVRDICSGIQQEHGDHFFKGKQVFSAAAFLDFPAMSQPLFFRLEPERVHFGDEFVEFVRFDSEHAGKYFGILFQFWYIHISIIQWN